MDKHNLVLRHQQPKQAMINSGYHINGLVQDSSNSIANALELLQSSTKP